MKRKVDWDEEKISGHEERTISDDESDSEKPRIKYLNNLSQVISKNASKLLHRMATCFGHLADNYPEINA